MASHHGQASCSKLKWPQYCAAAFTICSLRFGNANVVIRVHAKGFIFHEDACSKSMECMISTSNTDDHLF